MTPGEAAALEAAHAVPFPLATVHSRRDLASKASRRGFSIPAAADRRKKPPGGVSKSLRRP